MPIESDLQRKLRESQESRRRAWQALVDIRTVLAAVADDPLPPPSKPRCFATEGALLKKALVDILWRLHRDLDTLEKAVEGIRPAIGRSDSKGVMPNALIQLNRAMGKPRLPAGELAKLR